MNKLRYVSPSALEVWLKSKEEFYLKYCAVEKPPRLIQNQAMSVGSAFDAYAKSFIHQNLFGKNHKDSNQFDLMTIFESQVEPQNRSWAIKAGANCFRQYKESGALADLLVLLQRSDSEPRMEFSAEAIVEDNGNVSRAVSGVMILGKPDLTFRVGPMEIVHDFKVNGYISASGVNPAQGYIKYLEPKSRKHGNQHKEATPTIEHGFEYSYTPNIEMYMPSWGRQLCAYGWITGAAVGSDIIVSIDQLCCRPSFPDPIVGIAQHRCVLTKKFQLETLSLFQQVWDAVQSEHIFTELSLEESRSKQALLDTRAQAYAGDTPEDEWLRSLRQKGKL